MSWFTSLKALIRIVQGLDVSGPGVELDLPNERVLRRRYWAAMTRDVTEKMKSPLQTEIITRSHAGRLLINKVKSSVCSPLKIQRSSRRLAVRRSRICPVDRSM